MLYTDKKNKPEVFEVVILVIMDMMYTKSNKYGFNCSVVILVIMDMVYAIKYV